MAVTATVVTGASRVEGNKRVRVYDLVFSSNYATGGESLTAANLGLKKLEFLRIPGPVISTDAATACAVAYDYVSSKVVFYESGASGAALAEKTNSEAYPTGSRIRVEAVGY